MPAQCRDMCQLCEVNVSQAALLWTAAIVSGVMTPARGEQRCQRDEGEYACTRKKMTSSTLGSAQDNPQRQAALPGTTIRRRAFPPPSVDGLRGAPYVLHGYCDLYVCTHGHHNELADGGGYERPMRHVTLPPWPGMGQQPGLKCPVDNRLTCMANGKHVQPPQDA